LPTFPSGTVYADHVWKRFRADRTLPLFEDQLLRMVRRFRGEPRDWRWVLRDVNLHVEPGKTQGIIGVNGSGKSTLLKIICQTTFPSAGSMTSQGRIGALLEVRSGIHPDLSGRQNIYLYGNILGLSRSDISARFDDIVDFAEIGNAIDRQVKFYSTGMGIRLGFAIAAFLEPDILLVDEVLAVGDARFQQKCLERISEVVANGTTLFYVSHDLATVEAVCERAMWLIDSHVRADGPARDVVALYRASVEEQAVLTASTDTGVRLLKVEVSGRDGDQLRSGEEVNLRMVVESEEAMFGAFHIGISQGTAMPVFVLRYASSFPAGQFELRCRLQTLPLPKGRYSVWAAMQAPPESSVKASLSWQPVASFEAFGPNAIRAPSGVMVLSPVYVPAQWELS
jgi:ABC-type polysaccharide/polyol phosphate transport system ATPase subunit